MKKTTTVLLVLFLVLSSVAAWYLATANDKTVATYHVDEMDFAIESDLVYKVFVADRKGNKTTLVRTGDSDKWLLEGKLTTRQTAVNYLMDVIENVEVKYRPTKRSYTAITKDLATYGVEVELYGKNDELLKNYYVGGVDEEGKGTYMIMADSNEPFVTHITHFVGGLRSRFSMTGDDWRDKAIFRENPDEIMEVSVEYPKQRNQSFKLTREGSGFKVVPFYNTTPVINKAIVKGKPDQFLHGFKSKIAEAFQNEYTLMDEVRKKIPFAIIKMKLKDGTEKNVRFIPYQKLDTAGNLIKQNPNGPVFRFHADCSTGDFMLVQQGVFEEVFWSYEGFYK